jgi:microcystin-dependent protein
MGEDDFYAAISTFAGTYAPVNYALCQGQTFSLQQYTALYSLLGPDFGPSNNATVFTLPNLVAAVPVGVGESSTGTSTELGETGQAAAFSMSNGVPAAMAAGDTPTFPEFRATSTLGINYVICVNGYWPVHP